MGEWMELPWWFLNGKNELVQIGGHWLTAGKIHLCTYARKVGAAAGKC